MDLEGNETRISPANFLNIDMNKKIIKEIILTNLDDTYKYGSFKALLFKSVLVFYFSMVYFR